MGLLDAETALQRINETIGRSVARLNKLGFETRAPATADSGETKLFVRQGAIEVKIEVNFAMRGTVYPVRMASLTSNARDTLQANLEIPVQITIHRYPQKLEKMAVFCHFREEEEGAAAFSRQKDQLDLDQALVRYEAELKPRGQDIGNVSRARRHLSDVLLKTPVKLLSVDDLEGWRNELVERVAEEELERSTVNRTMTPVRAAQALCPGGQSGETDGGRDSPLHG